MTSKTKIIVVDDSQPDKHIAGLIAILDRHKAESIKSDKEIVQELLDSVEKDSIELKKFDETYLLEQDDNNPRHGPRKTRKGTNKKYVKRKKAKNGKTKRRK